MIKNFVYPVADTAGKQVGDFGLVLNGAPKLSQYAFGILFDLQYVLKFIEENHERFFSMQVFHQGQHLGIGIGLQLHHGIEAHRGFAGNRVESQLYPLATEQVEIDLDDGVKVNYPNFHKALKKVAMVSKK
jgi:hypothetical protein